ncbi:PD-(D/E)XK nuclease family protein [Aeromicrobium yanjiei]|uniref:PD-(D/E)XK nuclease family protein n=2 Tax=Aeromicrobium yanjiei TaxID=2662028 RepID=A0A5Q2MJB8_9ACTN|nr:PD-(D/E)XK nuclease family protein [Aeromicrobium yanjiei]
MKPVTVLAPSNVAGIVARRHLAAGLGNGTAGVAGMDITTLPRLAERIAANTFAPRRPQTRTVLTAAWRKALDEDAGVFGSVANHPSTIRALAEAHGELRDLTKDGLDALSTSANLTPSLVSLHRRVSAQLSADWYDETALLEAATRRIDEGYKVSAMILYLPQELSLAESAFAQALGQSGELVVIAGLTGARRADELVHRSLRRIGASTAWSPKIATAAKIINASDSDDEVRSVVREVVESLQTTPGHRIAVLYASASPYARLLHEQLLTAGVTVNGPGVRAVHERASARFLTEVLALVDNDVPRADLFRALANAPACDFTGTRIPVGAWERISRSAGVVGGTDWDQMLATFARDMLREADREDESGDRPWLADRHRNDAETACALRAFVTGLRSQLADATGIASWSDLADWAEQLFSALLGDAGGTLPPEEQYAAVTMSSVLRGMSVLETVDGSASLGALRDVLDLELASALPRVGKFGHGVLVAPISAAVGLELDVIYLVGLSEDTYPGKLREDALLSRRARAAVPDELTSQRDALHAKYRALLIAMSSAKSVVASFPRGDLRRSTHRLPSRWLLSSLRELSGNHRLPATEWEDAEYAGAVVTSGSFAGELLTTSVLASEQEWRTRAAIGGELDEAAVSSAHALLDARDSSEFTRFDGKVSETGGLPDYARGKKAVSPTALEAYASCPHAFFVERLLGVEPLEQPEDSVEISPMDIGNLVHESFDALVTEFADALPGYGQPWSESQRSRLVEIAQAKATEFEERGLTGHPTLWEREKHRVITDLTNMLDVDDAWRAETNSAVVASELSFGTDGIAPVEILVPSGTVLMRGSADKVDVAADGTLHVTDIKTGSKRRFKEITQDEPDVGGTKLQLPAYAYAARKVFGSKGTPVVTAYWFVRKDPGRVEIAMTAEVEDRYRSTLEVLVKSIRSGLFPAKAPETEDFRWVQCPYCNPDGIGHGEARERWERKRHDVSLFDLVALIDSAAITNEDPA